MLSVRPYGVTIDLWALGIFLYHVLRGRTPYEARTLDEVIQNMGHHSIRFSASTSSELVSLIQGLLDWRPETRLGCGLGGVADLRHHPWFEGLDWEAVYYRRHHTVLVPRRRSPPWVSRFAATEALPRTLTVLAANSAHEHVPQSTCGTGCCPHTPRARCFFVPTAERCTQRDRDAPRGPPSKEKKKNVSLL